jgi:hypothetical protein
LQTAAVVAVLISRPVHIHHKELSVDAMRHPAATRDQVLRDRIRADCHRNLLANRDRRLKAFARPVCLQALVNDLRHLTKRQFA